METSVAAQSRAGRQTLVASQIHMILVTAAVGAWAFCFKLLADQLSMARNPNRVRFYLVAILMEWLMFALVVAGVRRSGASLSAVLGDRWHSAGQVLRDIGIAAGFWIAAAILLWAFAWLLRITGQGRDLQTMLPHGRGEIALWVAVSVSAGICEETIFRGYLQRQLIALTKSAPAGILLSAAAFGAGHWYQGFRMTILISLYGVMFGILAYWRRSVRPGMIAHAWQDSLSGVVAGLMRH